MALRPSWWYGRPEGAAATGRLRGLAGLFEREHLCPLVLLPVWLQCESVAVERGQSAENRYLKISI
jgi:hypothetical protein